MAEPVNPEKIFPVSWDQFHRDSRALAWRLNGAGPFKAIVCITRGGLVPAGIVARELGVRMIETVCVESYAHQTQGQATQACDLSTLASLRALRATPVPAWARRVVGEGVKSYPNISTHSRRFGCLSVHFGLPR